tara:strand:- start:44 stop:484 length:441 start_codon:yes stop_codon:yes gene_type:complete
MTNNNEISAAINSIGKQKQDLVDHYISIGDFSLGGIYEDVESQEKIKRGDYVFGFSRDCKRQNILDLLLTGENTTSLEQLDKFRTLALPTHASIMRGFRWPVNNTHPRGMYGSYELDKLFIEKFNNNEILVIRPGILRKPNLRRVA